MWAHWKAELKAALLVVNLADQKGELLVGKLEQRKVEMLATLKAVLLDQMKVALSAERRVEK